MRGTFGPSGNGPYARGPQTEFYVVPSFLILGTFCLSGRPYGKSEVSFRNCFESDVSLRVTNDEI